MLKNVIVSCIKKLTFYNNEKKSIKDNETNNTGVLIMNKEGLYNALDIAQYVINYAIEQKKPVSNLKLQKILYYIQAAFLVEQGEPCFKEEIINWRHGPVVKEVYDNYRDYVDKDIKDIQRGYHKFIFDNKEVEFKFEFIEFSNKSIKDNHKRIIEKVIDAYLNKDAWELVERTHQEDPWKNYSSRNSKISLESIKDYFINNKSRIYGG